MSEPQINRPRDSDAVRRRFDAVRLQSVSPALLLAGGVGAMAIVAYRSWWSLVFIVFVVAVAAIQGTTVRPAEVVGIAISIGGTVAFGFAGSVLVLTGLFVDHVPCTPDPCGVLGPTLVIAGAAMVLVAAVGLVASGWHLRRRERWRAIWPGLNLFFLGLFGGALVLGPGAANGIAEIGGLTAASAALPHALGRSRLLQAALIGQVADLATFGPVWQGGLGEQNPLGTWIVEALFHQPSGGLWSWEASTTTAILMILAKLSLIGFLLGVTSHLGRYRRVVLVAATVAGTIGAAANIIVIVT